jgi:hypothetical protein
MEAAAFCMAVNEVMIAAAIRAIAFLVVMVIPLLF